MELDGSFEAGPLYKPNSRALLVLIFNQFYYTLHTTYFLSSTLLQAPLIPYHKSYCYYAWKIFCFKITIQFVFNHVLFGTDWKCFSIHMVVEIINILL